MSPKAFNGGHYSHPENQCILIPSELFVWLCFCISNARGTFNKTRETAHCIFPEITGSSFSKQGSFLGINAYQLKSIATLGGRAETPK